MVLANASWKVAFNLFGSTPFSLINPGRLAGAGIL